MPESTKNSVFLIFATIIVTLGLLALGAFGFWFYQERLVKSSPLPSSLASPIPAVSSEPTGSVMPVVQPSPSLAGKSDLEQIREAFAQKYSHQVSETNVTINKQQGKYASGGVSFTGEMGGGWWLAYNGDDGWIIVADGNGTVPCEAIDPYNFPTSMVPECFRESDGVLVTR